LVISRLEANFAEKKNDMKLSTSYFAQAKKLRDRGITIVSIALFPPRYYSGLKYKVLAPARDMLHLEGEAYVRRYYALLSGLDPWQIIEDIESLTGHAGEVALLCYEKPGELCHRRLVAEWLHEKTGTDVEEIKF
jgi:uncharacterized protein (DUF488 family)